MHALTAHPDVSPRDRLSVTFFFAVLAHLIVILGVTFVPEDRPERRAVTLDVVLVPPSSEATPEQPDYLAQANQDGGGDSIEKVRPETGPPPPPPPPPVASEPAVTTAIATAVATVAPGIPAVEPRIVEPAILSTPAPSTASTAYEAPVATPRPAHDTNALPPESRSAAIAALSAEIERKLRAYAERPRRKWISARTREDKFAAYLDAWRRKVEQVGNLNYPDEAVRRGLSGSLLLEVALNPDGTVEDIAIRRSSGQHLLDAAAVRIVRLAAPFARFPESIAEEVDILHIERTWIFHSGNRFSSP